MVALDGATGKDLRSYGVGGCWTLLLADGLLLAFDGKKVYAWDALTGVEKWTNPTVGAASTPVVAVGRIFFMRGSSGLTCLDLVSGKQVWQKDVADKNKIVFAFADKVLLCMDKTRQYTAISGIDGATAWTYTPPGIPDRYFYVSAGSIAWPAREALANTVFAGGLLWIKTTDDRDARSTKGFQSLTGGEAHKWFGLDPVTGEVRHVLQEPVALEFCCYPIYDTDRFLLSSRPLYFTDWKTETITRFEGTRLACLSSCGLGQGMFFGMYTPPKSKWCKCVRPAISGITAFASDHKTSSPKIRTPRCPASPYRNNPPEAPFCQPKRVRKQWLPGHSHPLRLCQCRQNHKLRECRHTKERRERANWPQQL